MFDLPEAKRVRREDLYGSDDDGEQQADTTAADAQRAALQAKLAALLGPIVAAPDVEEDTHMGDAPTRPAEEPHEEEFEFRLFAAPAATTATRDGEGSEAPQAQKIILSRDDDEDAPLGDGALLRTKPLSYYIAAPATAEQKREFASVAVDAETIVAWSRRRNYGLERPWRVRVVYEGDGFPGSKAQKAKRLAGPVIVPGTARAYDTEATPPPLDDPSLATPKPRTKPNKKRRILLRERAKKLAAKKEAERIRREKEAEEKKRKEEEYGEKRTERNRLRKIKRRERERRKKEAARLGLEVPAESDSEGEGEGQEKMGPGPASAAEVVPA
jgi:hypothetical protein